MPPATQDYKPLDLPTYDPEKAKALIAESGVSADLAIDFYYPSDVARPYMPDPKGESRGDRHGPRGGRLQDQLRRPPPGAPAT